MRLIGSTLRRVRDDAAGPDLSEFRGRRVNAVAGIGRPERFFRHLRALGVEVTAQAFADHHRFVAGDLPVDNDIPTIMTEKDAVKCRAFARDNDWYLPVEAQLDRGLDEKVLQLLVSHGGVFPRRQDND